MKMDSVSHYLTGAALLASLAASACVPAAEPVRVMVASSRPPAFEVAAAAQIRRCYRAPTVSSAGRQIITELRVRYAADGSLIGLPILISQSGVTTANKDYAGRMAEAATRAILRCSPLRIPVAYSRGAWTDLKLTFSPLQSA